MRTFVFCVNQWSAIEGEPNKFRALSFEVCAATAEEAWKVVEPKIPEGCIMFMHFEKPCI